MKKKYQSELLGAIHETATGLYKIDVISKKEMKEYNEDCLAQEPETEYTIKKKPEVANANA